MSRVRVVFLGTPDFAATSLARMIDDEHFDIVGVISQPDRPAGRKMQLKASPVKELALRHDLKVFTPETVNTQEFRESILALGAEAAAVVAFGQILGQKFLDLFPRGCVNVHGSLLPHWRGAAPIQRSVMAGDTVTGVALQIIVRKLDAGPVLGVRKLEVLDEMDALDVHDRLKVLGADLLHVEFMDYLRGHLQPLAQDESLATHAAKIDKAEARLDWTQTARELHNRVRGLAMGPLAYTSREFKVDGQASDQEQKQFIKILKTRLIDSASAENVAEPGQVVEVLPASFKVACSQGVLEVLEVQPESRARQTATDYLRGYPLKAGDRFL